jgi:hypothetical protein
MEKEERKKQSSLGSGHWVIKIFFKFPRAGITFFGGVSGPVYLMYSITASVVRAP